MLLIPFFRYCIPLPQKESHKDEKFLSTAEVRQRQEAGEIFDSRFFPTSSSKTAKSACPEGMVEDMKVKEAHPRIFLMGSDLSVQAHHVDVKSPLRQSIRAGEGDLRSGYSK
mmetsp:Transcript_14578/g.22323  ORF Transcript_14578/g.22323 Transcript_14578/m.22323 type:complete len:112 (+) Transcript_14578:122-457(+)